MSKKTIESKKQSPIKKAIGPVTKLEEHVNPEWWRNIFNPLYLKTDGDVVCDQNITTTEVDYFIQEMQLNPNLSILDACCGQGRHVLEFARRGFHKVEGIDRSHYLIQKAKERCKKEGLHSKFREGDVRRLPYGADQFDVVMLLGNSFGYFETVQDDLRVLKEIFRVLKPGGKIVIDISDGAYLAKNFQKRSWEWIGKKLFVCREREISIDMQRLISREVITHVGKGVIADQFYAERLYTQEGLTSLIDSADFYPCVFHGSFAPCQDKHHDLGMMEKRFIVSAVSKKQVPVAKRSAAVQLKHVAVLMGDPSKPDPIKPAGVFDEDDLRTINQLKSALSTMENEYKFTYINNHTNIFAELGKLQGKVDYVFNLCDEGLSNNPNLELHVPAILELMRIPYTGAGPQCLAHCYDKSLVRGGAREIGIPVPDGCFIMPGDTMFHLPIDFPVITKPNFGDGSFGITSKSIAYNHDDLISAIADIHDRLGYERPVLVEEFLEGQEISVGIIGDALCGFRVLPIIKKDYSMLPPELPPICSYESKWCPESPYWQIKAGKANLPEETEKLVINWTLKLFDRFGCQDYGRFDWRLDKEGNPKLLEINPNPGWCWDGSLAAMCALEGLSYADMLKIILKAAESRFQMTSQSNLDVLAKCRGFF